MQLGPRVLSDVCFLQTTIMQEPRPRGTTTEEKRVPWNMYFALPKTLGQIVTQDTTHCPASWPGPLPFRNPGELASAVIESSALLQRRELQLKATPRAFVYVLTNAAAGATRLAALRKRLAPPVPSLMRLVIGLFAVRRCSLPAKWRT